MYHARLPAAGRGQPGEKRRGFESKIDETRPGDRQVEKWRKFIELADQRLGQGAGVLTLALGVRQHPIGLKIPVDGICGPHLGRKAGLGQTGATGGIGQRPIKGFR